MPHPSPHLGKIPPYLFTALNLKAEAARKKGVDVINLGIGLYTPPIGTTLFISTSIARTSLGRTTRELWPFFAVAMLVLLGVSYLPFLTVY